MKKTVILLVLLLCISNVIAQRNLISGNSEYDKENSERQESAVVNVLSDIGNPEPTNSEFSNLRGDQFEWYYFNEALQVYYGNMQKFYTALFPDAINAVYQDQSNPGSYTLGIARYHSVGAAFTPHSEIFDFGGYSSLGKSQPYSLDSIGIYYNYLRFTNDSIVDTLIIRIFKDNVPGHIQTFHYYYFIDDNPNLGIDLNRPAGVTVHYDTIIKNGKYFWDEVKILLTKDDAIEYDQGIGFYTIPLENCQLYEGGTVAITFSFKPGYTYSLTDTINAAFDQTFPHSDINHFFFWNLKDRVDFPIEEFNNGMYVFTGASVTPWNTHPTHGPIYWKSINFIDERNYTEMKFGISYDPDYIGIDDRGTTKLQKIFPNPATNNARIRVELVKNELIKVDLYNTLGQNVLNLVNQEYPTGEQIIDLNLERIPSGFYLCKLTIGDIIRIENLIIE